MIVYKSREEIDKMRRAGRIVATTIDAVLEKVRTGISTRALDEVAERVIRKEGATPSFLGYRGYPASICASLNDQIVHGIPGERIIEEGDILSLDFGAILGFPAHQIRPAHRQFRESIIVVAELHRLPAIDTRHKGLGRLFRSLPAETNCGSGSVQADRTRHAIARTQVA